MNHEYYRDRVSAYHDQDLTPEETRMMQEHLESCEECRALLKQFEKLDQLVEAHSGLDGDDYWEQAAQKIDRAIAGESDATEVTDIRPAHHGLFWKITAVAASVAVLTFIGLNRNKLFEQQETIQEQPSEVLSIPHQPQTDDNLPAMDEGRATVEEPETIVGDWDEAEETPAPAIAETLEQSVDSKASITTEEQLQEKPEAVGIILTADAIKTQPVKKTAPEKAEIEKSAKAPLPPQGNSDSEKDKEEKSSNREEIGHSIKVTSRADVIDKFQVTNQVVRTNPITDVDSLLDSGASIRRERMKVVQDSIRDSIQTELNCLREKRDGLLAQVQQGGQLPGGAAKALGSETADSKQSAPTMAAGEAVLTADSIQQLQLNLLETWYQISLITPDSTEFHQAVDYLNVATNHHSKEVREQAGEYLQILAKHRRP
ncbi:MAG TPA: zf-HC2 domain-containing protein [candidate division Zixibacteria bacterium]|nr:zf-HC2 domain-containing protein [candidate division Zixibacteria bacterium]